MKGEGWSMDILLWLYTEQVALLARARKHEAFLVGELDHFLAHFRPEWERENTLMWLLAEARARKDMVTA